ncbi:hypothetical protein KPSB59_840014 [Klebsiella quasipneumoniae subsp. quasipneumoniae]|nr:hypothetical protein KPSB59_840014 [Klebsiella quasipneumoniae subsp. quasipneumoniae]
MPLPLAVCSFLTLHLFSDYADYKQECRSECPVVTVGAELNDIRGSGGSKGRKSCLVIACYVWDYLSRWPLSPARWWDYSPIWLSPPSPNKRAPRNKNVK